MPGEEQIQANAELCRWSRRRYPTAGERLAYARRKSMEWTRPSERVAPDAVDGMEGHTEGK